MYKLLLSSMVTVSLSSGCSKMAGNPTSASAATTVPHNSFSVMAETDLPICIGEIIGRLYYIESTTVFKVCKSTYGWTTIAINGTDGTDGTDGTNGTPGITISSVKSISASTATDYCTEITGESCYFKGGQVTTLSDGSFVIQFLWKFTYYIAGDSDAETVSSTLFLPSSYSGAAIPMHPLVARGTGYKTVYLVYSKTTPNAAIWVDANGDGTIAAGTDELLYTATLTSL